MTKNESMIHYICASQRNKNVLHAWLLLENEKQSGMYMKTLSNLFTVEKYELSRQS